MLRVQPCQFEQQGWFELEPRLCAEGRQDRLRQLHGAKLVTLLQLQGQQQALQLDFGFRLQGGQRQAAFQHCGRLLATVQVTQNLGMQKGHFGFQFSTAQVIELCEQLLRLGIVALLHAGIGVKLQNLAEQIGLSGKSAAQSLGLGGELSPVFHAVIKLQGLQQIARALRRLGFLRHAPRHQGGLGPVFPSQQTLHKMLAREQKKLLVSQEELHGAAQVSFRRLQVFYFHGCFADLKEDASFFRAVGEFLQQRYAFLQYLRLALQHDASIQLGQQCGKAVLFGQGFVLSQRCEYLQCLLVAFQPAQAFSQVIFQDVVKLLRMSFAPIVAIGDGFLQVLHGMRAKEALFPHSAFELAVRILEQVGLVALQGAGIVALLEFQFGKMQQRLLAQSAGQFFVNCKFFVEGKRLGQFVLGIVSAGQKKRGLGAVGKLFLQGGLRQL